MAEPEDRWVRLLRPDKALIFRITHIENVPWLLDNGLHCANSEVRDPSFRRIGNPDLISRRSTRIVPIPPGGTLGDYVPFYFTPVTPMLLNIKTGYQGTPQLPMSEIVTLVSSAHRVAELDIPLAVTDRHAYLTAARFDGTLAGLDRIDWGILQARAFQRSADDPGKIERYQAEALVHRSLPVDGLDGIACQGKQQESWLRGELIRRGVSLRLVVRPEWYFS